MPVALRLLPLLLLYGYLVVSGAVDGLQKDEITYVGYAHNLLYGHFAPAGTEFLWSGPGYPLFLAPFVALGAPPLVPRLCNAVMLYLAVLLFHRAVSAYVSPRRALCAAYLLGGYWPLWEEMPLMMSEVFVTLLICLVLQQVSSILRDGGDGAGTVSRARLCLAAASLASLALTKVVFGYVILGLIALSAILWFARRRVVWRRLLATSAVAMLFCSPYLLYTYSLTGRTFLWATSGGMQLYWMSSPHAEEHGDWINYVHAASNNADGKNPVILRHCAVFEAALGYTDCYEEEPHAEFVRRLGVKQNDVFLDHALGNIAAHPGKYASNWLSNVSRMLFDTPYSYRPTDPGFWNTAAASTVLLLALIFGLIRAWRRAVALPMESYAIAAVAVLYLGASSLISAYSRHFYVMVPMLLWWAVVALCAPSADAES